MNAFEAFADERTPNPVKARQAVAEKRAKQHAERRAEIDAAIENDIHLKQWRAWRREEVDQALAGPYGKSIAALIERLKRTRDWHAIEPEIIARDWAGFPKPTRELVAGIVSAFITAKREAVDLPPFDDTLPF